MTAPILFVDTTGWMMLADGSDPAHHPAATFRDKWLEEGGVLLSTDFVLDETLTLLRMRLGLDAAETWWKTVDASSRVIWEWVDPTRAEKARSWFFRWRDKDFSFTDCTSFVVMSERRLAKVMTSDRHFAEAGFGIVPVPPRARRRRRRRR